jgi:hypothetical protein
MKSKIDKEKTAQVNKSSGDKNVSSKKASSKDEIEGEDDDIDMDEKPLKKGSASKKGKPNDDEDDAEDVEDNWEKADEDDFDPDFEEFDIPKSKIKTGSTKGKGDDDDLGLDDDFKTLDLFDDGTGGDDDDDEDF